MDSSSPYLGFQQLYSLLPQEEKNVLDLVEKSSDTALKKLFLNPMQINNFMQSQTPTPKIYPILPSCPTYIPPCYQPMMNLEQNNEVMNTEESLCDNFAVLPFLNNVDLKPSAPLLSDLVVAEKGMKRKALCHLNENKNDREFKKAKILCPSLS